MPLSVGRVVPFALVMVASACGGSSAPIQPIVEGVPPASIAGRWVGNEVFQPLASAPPGHCLVTYFRVSPAPFSIALTLTLTQTGSAIQGTLASPDRVAFSPLSCEVSGSYVDGRATIAAPACAAQTFGLNASCQGTLRRTDGRLVLDAASGMLGGASQYTVLNTGVGGGAGQPIDWRGVVQLRPE